MTRLQTLILALTIALVGFATPAAAQYIVAHRGASHDAPENTLAAFRLAWEQGADGVEGDFYLSADGRIVCIHDKDTERTAGEKHVVADTPFAELRKLDVGSWKGPQWQGERIPTLEEVMATVPRGKLLFIELKMGPEIVPPLMEVLATSVMPLENVVVISFDQQAIAACEAEMPELKSYWLTSYKEHDDRTFTPEAPEVAAVIERIHADGLGSKAQLNHFDAGFLQQLRDRGVTDYHVWTVDDPTVGRAYQRLGAWGITTNRPRWLRERLDPTRPPAAGKAPAAAR